MRTFRLDEALCQLIESELGRLLQDQDLPGLAVLYEELRTAPNRQPDNGMYLAELPTVGNVQAHIWYYSQRHLSRQKSRQR